MNLASIKTGDIVEVDKKGRRFHALVRGLDQGELAVHPFDRRVTYRQATAREVVGIWHANRQTAARYRDCETRHG